MPEAEETFTRGTRAKAVMRYTHVSSKKISEIKSPLDDLDV